MLTKKIKDQGSLKSVLPKIKNTFFLSYFLHIAMSLSKKKCTWLLKIIHSVCCESFHAGAIIFPCQCTEGSLHLLMVKRLAKLATVTGP